MRVVVGELFEALARAVAVAVTGACAAAATSAPKAVKAGTFARLAVAEALARALDALGVVVIL